MAASKPSKHQHPLIMLLELLALGASMYVLFGPYVGYEHGQTRYLAVLPALVALLLFMEYPAPGHGVGLPAAPLGGLELLQGDLPLEKKDGALLLGHVYIVVWFKNDKGGRRGMRPVETVHRKLGSHAKVHLLAVPLMAKDAATAFVAQWKRTLTLPIAHDPAGTATASYVTAHGQSSPFLPSVMPLAFVVGPDGVIRWQGHPNRKAFAASALDTVRGVLLAEKEAGESKKNK